MELIDKKRKLVELKKHWLKLYGSSKLKQFKIIKQQILQIDENTATYKDMAQITGSNYWNQMPFCEECNITNSETIRLGFKNKTFEICKECLQKIIFNGMSVRTTNNTPSKCEECGNETTETIKLGKEPKTFILCKICLHKAYILFDENI